MSPAQDDKRDVPRPTPTGPNDRPRDETISSTGQGLPDGGRDPVEMSSEEKQIADKILDRRPGV